MTVVFPRSQSAIVSYRITLEDEWHRIKQAQTSAADQGMNGTYDGGSWSTWLQGYRVEGACMQCCHTAVLTTPFNHVIESRDEWIKRNWRTTVATPRTMRIRRIGKCVSESCFDSLILCTTYSMRALCSFLWVSSNAIESLGWSGSRLHSSNALVSPPQNACMPLKGEGGILKHENPVLTSPKVSKKKTPVFLKVKWFLASHNFKTALFPKKKNRPQERHRPEPKNDSLTRQRDKNRRWFLWPAVVGCMCYPWFLGCEKKSEERRVHSTKLGRKTECWSAWANRMRARPLSAV